MDQLGLFKPDIKWDPPEFRELEGDQAWDLETHDPTLHTLGPGWCWENTGKIIGFSVTDSTGFTGYYPVGHIEGNLPLTLVLKWVQRQLDKPGRKFFANAQYDLGWFKRYGLRYNPDELHDVQLMSPVLDELRFSHSLDNLARDFLGDKKDERELADAAQAYGLGAKKRQYMQNLHRLPAKFVAGYAEHDSRITYQLSLELLQRIQKEDKEDNATERGLMTTYELERSLIPVLVDMRYRGVRIDREKAKRLKREWEQKRVECISRIKDISGITVDEWAAESVEKAFIAMGITNYPRTEKTNQPSFTQDWLKANGTELAQQVLGARRYQKAASTFIDSILRYSEKDGRIHCQFNQMKKGEDEGGTVTGRFSSQDPNLQQQPSPEKDPEIGGAIRSLYLPEEGQRWAALDYSAQEPRFTVHWAHVANMEGAEEAARKYNEDADTDYHQMVADMCGIERKPAKIINLGLAYGMGEVKLCNQLGLPLGMWETREGQVRECAGDEGKKLFELYHKSVPFVKGLTDLCTRKAKKRGYVRTYVGRKLHFYKSKDGYYAGTHKAMNKLIQGSSADQVKIALRKMWDAGLTLLLTIHDENDISFESYEELQIASKIMLEAIKISVPSKLDIEIGENWGELEEEIVV